MVGTLRFHVINLKALGVVWELHPKCNPLRCTLPPAPPCRRTPPACCPLPELHPGLRTRTAGRALPPTPPCRTPPTCSSLCSNSPQD